MKVTPREVEILAGLAIVALGIYVVRKGGAAVKDIVTKDLNPVSDQNLAYRGVNGVGAALTGDQSFSLGSWIYDLTHKAYDPNAGSVTYQRRDSYDPTAPGDVRSEYVTAAPGAAPGLDYGLNAYLDTGSFPALVYGTDSSRSDYVTR